MSCEIRAARLNDGEIVWREALPATVVVRGLAVDHEGRVFVALEDGRLMCLGKKE